MSNTSHNFLFLVVILCFIGTFISLLFSRGEYYEVHKSWTTKQCVKVIIYNSENPNGTEFDCPETLPEKYHNVWVK